MRIYILVLILTLNVFSQKEVSFRVWAVTIAGDFSPILRTGMHDSATFNADKYLDIVVPAPPPNYEIYGLYNFYDSVYNETVYAESNFIPLIKGKQTYYETNLYMWQDSELDFTFHWDDLKDIVDSAYIQDLDAILYKEDMLKTNSLAIKHEFINKLNFKLKLWYNPKILGIENSNSINFYFDYISKKIISNENIDKIEIFDLFGKSIQSFDNYKDKIINLPSGLYFFKIFSNNKFTNLKVIID